MGCANQAAGLARACRPGRRRSLHGRRGWVIRLGVVYQLHYRGEARPALLAHLCVSEEAEADRAAPLRSEGDVAGSTASSHTNGSSRVCAARLGPQLQRLVALLGAPHGCADDGVVWVRRRGWPRGLRRGPGPLRRRGGRRRCAVEASEELRVAHGARRARRPRARRRPALVRVRVAVLETNCLAARLACGAVAERELLLAACGDEAKARTSGQPSATHTSNSGAAGLKRTAVDPWFRTGKCVRQRARCSGLCRGPLLTGFTTARTCYGTDWLLILARVALASRTSVLVPQ